jgi:hypothetical protein
LTCAKDKCGATLDACDAMTGTASAGPAQGTSKSRLCAESLDCALRTGCGRSGTAMPCYCGTAQPAECLAGKAAGPCKASIERGLEITDPLKIATAFGDSSLGAGAAMSLVVCLAENCKTTCN